MTLVVKSLPANAGDIGDAGSNLGAGRSPGEGNGNPLVSCLENPMERGAWQVTQSTGLQRVRQDWSNLACTHACKFQVCIFCIIYSLINIVFYKKELGELPVTLWAPTAVDSLQVKAPNSSATSELTQGSFYSQVLHTACSACVQHIHSKQPEHVDCYFNSLWPLGVFTYV